MPLLETNSKRRRNRLTLSPRRSPKPLPPPPLNRRSVPRYASPPTSVCSELSPEWSCRRRRCCSNRRLIRPPSSLPPTDRPTDHLSRPAAALPLRRRLARTRPACKESGRRRRLALNLFSPRPSSKHAHEYLSAPGLYPDYAPINYRWWRRRPGPKMQMQTAPWIIYMESKGLRKQQRVCVCARACHPHSEAWGACTLQT